MEDNLGEEGSDSAREVDCLLSCPELVMSQAKGVALVNQAVIIRTGFRYQ